MFSYLKNKIKSSVKKVAQLLEKEPKGKEEIHLEEEIKYEELSELPKTEHTDSKIKEHPIPEIKEISDEKVSEEKIEYNKNVQIEDALEEPKKKTGIFEKIKERVLTIKIDENKFEFLFHELEVGLLENNVAYEVVEKIKDVLKSELVNHPITRFKIEDAIKESLRKSIESLFDVDDINLFENIKKKRPYVICFVGINGSGKTTTIAKLANLLKSHGISSVIAAGDTFRAASIEQLDNHGENLEIKVIKHKYGSDPAAVAFDAIKHANAKNIDVVLIDTAGRMHSNVNLINEMKKIMRVTKPDLKIFVGESITGNDCIEQARIFNSAIGIDGIILTKADVDEKGGTAISIGYITKKPILFLGTGQDYDELREFDKKVILEGLGFYSG